MLKNIFLLCFFSHNIVFAGDTQKSLNEQDQSSLDILFDSQEGLAEIMQDYQEWLKEKYGYDKIGKATIGTGVSIFLAYGAIAYSWVSNNCCQALCDLKPVSFFLHFLGTLLTNGGGQYTLCDLLHHGLPLLVGFGGVGLLAMLNTYSQSKLSEIQKQARVEESKFTKALSNLFSKDEEIDKDLVDIYEYLTSERFKCFYGSSNR